MGGAGGAGRTTSLATHASITSPSSVRALLIGGRSSDALPRHWWRSRVENVVCTSSFPHFSFWTRLPHSPVEALSRRRTLASVYAGHKPETESRRAYTFSFLISRSLALLL